MKISKETITILKNYASINPNLLLKPGNKLSTISTNKTVASTVSVTETWETEFGIYDLNAFLGALSLFDSPELSFSDKFVTLEEKGNRIRYFASDAGILIVPQKDINFPTDASIEFSLSGEMLDTIHKTAGILKAVDLSIIGNNGKLTVEVGDKKNDTSNRYETVVGETDLTFRANIKIENLKMLRSDYIVTVSSKRISRFKSKNGDLVYYVAVEADSTF